MLKQHKDSLQAHHRGMADMRKIYPLSSFYHIHNQVAEPILNSTDADYDLLASAETAMIVKASKFKAIESARSSLSVLSFIEHFDVASTKLL